MTLLKGRQIDEAVRALPSGISAVLLFGEDQGLVQERANLISKQIVEDLSDPFNVVRADNGVVRDNPSLLADELASISMMGGARLVRLDGFDPRMSITAFENALESDANENLLVVTAGDLTRGHKLIKLFSESPKALVIQCYHDKQSDVAGVVRQFLDSQNLKAPPEALAYLIANLGNDRIVTRNTLEKLSLYMASSSEREMSLDDVKLMVGDNSDLHLNEIATAVTGGESKQVDLLLDRAERQKESAVGILRAVQRRLQRLYTARGHLDQGLNLEAALKKLRPTPNYFEKPAFSAHLQNWSGERLMRALTICLEAEKQIKTTGMPAQSICSRTCLQLAVNAPKRRAH